MKRNYFLPKSQIRIPKSQIVSGIAVFVETKEWIVQLKRVNVGIAHFILGIPTEIAIPTLDSQSKERAIEACVV